MIVTAAYSAFSNYVRLQEASSSKPLVSYGIGPINNYEGNSREIGDYLMLESRILEENGWMRTRIYWQIENQFWAGFVWGINYNQNIWTLKSKIYPLNFPKIVLIDNHPLLNGPITRIPNIILVIPLANHKLENTEDFVEILFQDKRFWVRCNVAGASAFICENKGKFSRSSDKIIIVPRGQLRLWTEDPTLKPLLAQLLTLDNLSILEE